MRRIFLTRSKIAVLIAFALHFAVISNIVRAQSADNQETEAAAASNEVHDYSSLGFNELFVLNNLRVMGKSASQSILEGSEVLFAAGRQLVVGPSTETLANFNGKVEQIELDLITLGAFAPFGIQSQISDFRSPLYELQTLTSSGRFQLFNRRQCPEGVNCAENIQRLGNALVKIGQSARKLRAEFERQGAVTTNILAVPVASQLPVFLTASASMVDLARGPEIISGYLLGDSPHFRASTRLIDYIGANEAATANALRSLLASLKVQDSGDGRDELSSLLLTAVEVLKR